MLLSALPVAMRLLAILALVVGQIGPGLAKTSGEASGWIEICGANGPETVKVEDEEQRPGDCACLQCTCCTIMGAGQAVPLPPMTGLRVPLVFGSAVFSPSMGAVAVTAETIWAPTRGPPEVRT